MEMVGMHPEVYKAAKSGDFEKLKTIVSGNGEDLFPQTTPKGNNILHIAAQYEQIKFIEELLRCPSGPLLLWESNYKGDTPFHVAAKVGSCEAVRIFTDLAKSVHWVVQDGQVDACAELLRKPNLLRDTTLHHAIRGGHEGLVELLIEEDPQLCDIVNAANESVLYLAADRGLSRATELILGALSSSSSHMGPKGLTALHAGISLSLASWEKIMEKRPELTRQTDDIGWTPFHYVAYLGKVEAVRLLLQHDTSLAYKLDGEGQSAFHLAASEGHVSVVDVILRSCPDACDIINNKGQTALHTAVISGRLNIVKSMLAMPNQNDLINEQDSDGNTALHLAALHKRYEIIYILARDKRVDRLAKNKNHLTASDIFGAHKETSFSAARVHYLLKEFHGIPGFQGWFTEYGKKRMDKQFVQGQPSVSVNPGSNIANQDNLDLSKKSITDVQLSVAMFMATVTYAMTLAVPGGYINDGPDRGKPIFAERAHFKAFVAYNSLAFIYSMMAIITRCAGNTFSYGQEPKGIGLVACFIDVAASSIILAYLMVIRLVSNKPSAGKEDEFVQTFMCGLLMCFFLNMRGSDREGHSWLRGRFPARHITEFVSECAIKVFEFRAWLIWSLGKL